MALSKHVKVRLKIILLILFVTISFGVLTKNASAQDFLVEFLEEHYKEQNLTGGGEIQIYHTWQVKSEFGTKLLVLTGNDYTYRQWLRQYLNNHVLFSIKIPDGGEDSFRYDMIIHLDVRQIHSVYEKNWSCPKCRLGPPPIKDETKPSPGTVNNK